MGFVTYLKHKRQEFNVTNLVGSLDVEEKMRAKDTYTLFGCRYWSLELGIGITFPEFCYLDVEGIEIWNCNLNIPWYWTNN
jgi:hypothetical protein